MKKKTALTTAVGISLLFSVLFVPTVQAEQWSTPTYIAPNPNSWGAWIYQNIALSMTANGSKIVFPAWMGSNTEIFIINSDGTGLKQLTNDSRMDGYPSISGDGSKIAFLSFGLFDFGSEVVPIDYELYVVNSDGTELRQLTTWTMESGVPSISGDGSKIAFCSSGALFVINSNGTGLKKLTNGTNDVNPSICSDGSKIAFVSQVYDSPFVDGYDPEYDDYELFVINSDGTTPTQLTFNLTLQYSTVHPSISSDGSKIAFCSSGALFVINSNGTGLKQLNGNANIASISGDGGKIVFSSFTSQNYLTFFVVNANGTELANLGFWNVDSIAGGPSISEDGCTIAIPLYLEGILVSSSTTTSPSFTPTTSPSSTPTPSPSLTVSPVITPSDSPTQQPTIESNTTPNNIQDDFTSILIIVGLVAAIAVVGLLVYFTKHKGEK